VPENFTPKLREVIAGTTKRLIAKELHVGVRPCDAAERRIGSD